jgi:hypothetical protein
MDCGGTFRYWQMDFDHLRDKSFNIGESARVKELEQVKKEIEKCELVCANCHRTRTFNRNWGHKH